MCGCFLSARKNPVPHVCIILGFTEKGAQVKISDTFSPVETISSDQAKKELSEKKEGAIQLVDVREHQEYEEGHLPGARLIPLSRILDHLRELDTSRPVITYCRSGNRSRSAAALMKTQGFENVRSMDGGIMAWNGLVATGPCEAGMFLIRDRKTPEELISLAWMLEDGTGFFYEKAGDIVTDDRARQTFASLVKAEQKHKMDLMDAYKKLNRGEMAEETGKSRTVHGVMESGVSVQDALAWLVEEGRELRDILEFSMQIETNSLDLYTKIFRRIDEKETGEIFLSLIEDEKAHLARLGDVLGRTTQKQGTVHE